MARDIFIFTASEPLIPIDDLVAELRARGQAVQWHSRRIPREPEGRDWLSGYFTGENDTTPLARISNELLTPAALAETVETAPVDGARRATLAQSRRQYRVVPEGAASTSKSLVIHLADIIAARASGLIHDAGANQFYEGTEFRRAHTRVLGS
jgi:hypothetical protein